MAMIIRNAPCDCDGICPYESEYQYSCEYWCGEDEDNLSVYEEYVEYDENNY